MQPIRIKVCQESDLRMLGTLARNIQRVLPVTQADIDAAAALGKGWVVKRVYEVSDPLNNLRGGTQLVIKQNSVLPGQNVQRVLIVANPEQQTVIVGPGIPPLLLPNAIANELLYVKAYGGLLQSGVPSGVPSSYTAVEYVENTTGTMVKTAIHIGNDDNFKIDITATAVAGSFYLFQARDKVNSNLGNANITGISGATSGNTLLGSPGIDGVSVSNGLTRANRTGHKMRFVLDIADGDMSWYVRDLDGNVENTATGTYDPTQLNRATTNMCIYGNEAPAGSGAGQTANRLQSGCKVYGAKLWKNGVLVLDYVPATRDSDSAVGFYDRVSHTFVTAADGSLTAGNSLAPTPSDPVDLVCNNGALKILDKNDWTIFTNPTSIAGQGVFINSSGKWQAVGDRGAGCAIPLTIGKQYTLVIHKKTVSLGQMLRYGQSPQITPTSAGIQLTDWYRGGITDGQMVSFVAKQPYFVMQLGADPTEAGMIQEAIEVIEAQGDNETLAITTKNLCNVATDIDGYYIGADGTIGTNASSCYSALIPVVAGQTYTWGGICGNSGSSNNKRVHAYIDGVWNQQISLTVVPSNTPFEIVFTVPAGCNGIRISRWNTDTQTQVEIGSTKTAYIAYNDSTAGVANLFKISNYVDTQEILTGVINHQLGVMVFDGTEDWTVYGTPNPYFRAEFGTGVTKSTSTEGGMSTHFAVVSIGASTTNQGMSMWVYNNKDTVGIRYDDLYPATSANLASFKSWLAAQYAAGTPVMMVFPLLTPQDEVAPVPQTMQVVAGDNVLDIVQAGMSGLEVEVQYTKGG